MKLLNLSAISFCLMFLVGTAHAERSLFADQFSTTVASNIQRLFFSGSGLNNAALTVQKSATATEIQITVETVGDNQSNATSLAQSMSTSQDGSDLQISSNTMFYECEISTFNGEITKLHGGCYHKITVTVPDQIDLQVYIDNQLEYGDNNRPVSFDLLMDQLNTQSFDDDKMKTIQDFVTSEGQHVTPLTCDQLEQILKSFSFPADELHVFKILQGNVVDRTNLPQTIKDSFTFPDDRDQAFSIALQTSSN